jgi:hypothetical protein
MFKIAAIREFNLYLTYDRRDNMKIGRIVKTAIKYAPIAYPIIRKAMQKKKPGNTSQYKTPQAKRSR